MTVVADGAVTEFDAFDVDVSTRPGRGLVRRGADRPVDRRERQW